MTSFLYALNIGTLAVCMTATGASTVANLVHSHDLTVASVQQVANLDEGTFVDLDRPDAGAAGGGGAVEEAPQTVETLEIAQEILPDMPEVAEADSLPTVPEFHQVALEKPRIEKPKPIAVKSNVEKKVVKSSAPKSTSVAKQANANQGGAGKNVASRGGSGSGKGGGIGSGEGKSVGSGKGRGSVGASRFAGGSTPQPGYPANCRQRGEKGSVTVNFTVNEQGHVVDVRLVNATKYPELNEAALRAVRRWKFTNGPRASANKTISFVL